MFLRSLPLKGGRITVPIPERKFQNGLEVSLKLLLTKLHSKRSSIKTVVKNICGLIRFSFVSDVLWWSMSVKPCLIFF